MKQFDFGTNWLDFSRHACTRVHVELAKGDFRQLFQDIDLTGKTFLDVGFGQGLSLLTAAEAGALCVGNDINPKCCHALRLNAAFYPDTALENVKTAVGSILDERVVQRILRTTADGKGFDIVHAWGSLHHTGDMWQAIEITSQLVSPGGFLALAIYNRHWTSPIWKRIKHIYNVVPETGKKTMLFVCGVIKFFGAWATMGERPTIKSRGMDFKYDMIDWLGGYPYEYAADYEILNFMKSRGFILKKLTPQKGWTGTVEYLFRKNGVLP